MSPKRPQTSFQKYWMPVCCFRMFSRFTQPEEVCERVRSNYSAARDPGLARSPVCVGGGGVGGSQMEKRRGGGAILGRAWRVAATEPQTGPVRCRKGLGSHGEAKELLFVKYALERDPRTRRESRRRISVIFEVPM